MTETNPPPVHDRACDYCPHTEHAATPEQADRGLRDHIDQWHHRAWVLDKLVAEHDNRTADGRANVGPGGSLDLDNVFTYHPPFGDQTDRYEAIREVGKHFADVITRLCPGSPERSTAISRIRETVMWANAAIACHERPPVTPEECYLTHPHPGPCVEDTMPDVQPVVVSPAGEVQTLQQFVSGEQGVTVSRCQLTHSGPRCDTPDGSCKVHNAHLAAQTAAAAPSGDASHPDCLIVHDLPVCDTTDGSCRYANPVAYTPDQVIASVQREPVTVGDAIQGNTSGTIRCLRGGCGWWAVTASRSEGEALLAQHNMAEHRPTPMPDPHAMWTPQDDPGMPPPRLDNTTPR